MKTLRADRFWRCLAFCVGCFFSIGAVADALRINQLQFVGSHNSYKQAMSPEHAAALRERNPAAAQALDYAHIPLADQLSLGIRKLELDLFARYSDAVSQNSAQNSAEHAFTVGHVQAIDMNTHCATLRLCLTQILAWSEQNPTHVPLWISFNTKDQKIPGLPDPVPFSPALLDALDAVLEDVLGEKLLAPADVLSLSGELTWPLLDDARGRVLLVLDEGGDKLAHYVKNWHARPMFANLPVAHPGAAIMVVNEPLLQGERIAQLVRRGYMVRTRADADTLEARSGDVRRREAAFTSGAQAISTDYYLPTSRFSSNYVVVPRLTCNPVLMPGDCRVSE